MGKVYRATDINLKRPIAIKVLPEAVATDAERVARFQREAEVLARLNHPNIAQIYGLEKSDGTIALVMELIEGPTLADRIAQGPIPIDEALRIAQQIVEALEAAHERGIVHRDLKPANIKLRPDGAVKVLDFGLAKALEPVIVHTDATQSPTVTSPAMTRLGVILGTAAYMSPEQARGRAVDKRSDIWAFGCVMFEMLVGAQLFGGEDVTESIAAIVRAEPDWGRLPPDAPAAIRRLLRRCLAKDPKERLTDIGVARLEIKDALTAPFSEANVPAALPPGRARGPWIVAALSVALTLAMVAWSLQRRSADPFPMRLEITPPTGFSPESLALSPDGKQLAFVAPVNGIQSLWVRQLDQDSAQPVPGTSDASLPFWAPDGRAIGFFAGGSLKRVDLPSGSPQILADVTVGRGGSWSAAGVIVFASALNSGLMRVAAGGGVPVAATGLSGGQRGHRWPQFLPDGRHFLFFAQGDGDSHGVFVGSLDGGTPARLLDSNGPGWYASGHLIFDSGGTLNAAPFDVNRRRLTGDSVPIQQNAARSSTGTTTASFSSTGLLAYAQGSLGQRRLVWVDRAGNVVGSVGQPDDAALANPELSADGHQVAVTRQIRGGAPSVWLIDVARGVPTPLAVGAGNHTAPFWFPDGKRVLFRFQAGGRQKLLARAVDGLSDAKVLFESETSKTPSGWSPDGRVLLYVMPGDDLMAMDAESQKSFPVAQTSANEGWGEFSPDGRFVAYQSNESGRFEIYVRTFPGAEGKWLVSVGGGTQARWRRDGK